MVKIFIYGLFATLVFFNSLYSRTSVFQKIIIVVEPFTELVIKGEDPVITVPMKSSDMLNGKITKSYEGISFSYSCSDGCIKKIIGQLDRDTPKGLDINVYLSAPEGALSTGFQTLSSVESDLIININGKSGVTNAQMSYQIVVDENFNLFNNYERKVIFTLIDQ